MLTAVLTLAGGLVLLRFQSASKAAEERRAARRQWHEEAVDVAVDVGNLILDAGILALNLPVRGRDGDLMNHFDRWTELQEVWATTLRRRVQRIARGHPDSGMRAQAKLIGDSAVQALQTAFSYVMRRSEGYHNNDIDDIIQVFDSKLMLSIRSYVHRLHGTDEEPAQHSASTLRRTFEIYAATGTVLKPNEMSPP